MQHEFTWTVSSDFRVRRSAVQTRLPIRKRWLLIKNSQSFFQINKLEQILLCSPCLAVPQAINQCILLEWSPEKPPVWVSGNPPVYDLRQCLPKEEMSHFIFQEHSWSQHTSTKHSLGINSFRPQPNDKFRVCAWAWCLQEVARAVRGVDATVRAERHKPKSLIIPNHALNNTVWSSLFYKRGW